MDVEEIIEMLTVSSGDSIESVSCNGDFGNVPANIYVINMLQDEEPVSEVNVSEEVSYTLWDKPLDEYSVSEGLLLIIALVIFLYGVCKTIIGGFKC